MEKVWHKLWASIGSNIERNTVFGEHIKNEQTCYELKSLELDKRTNSCIRVNTRELNRDSFTN